MTGNPTATFTIENGEFKDHQIEFEVAPLSQGDGQQVGTALSSAGGAAAVLGAVPPFGWLAAIGTGIMALVKRIRESNSTTVAIVNAYSLTQRWVKFPTRLLIFEFNCP